MFVKDKDKNIEVIHITEELYKYYQNLEAERDNYKFWHYQLKEQDDKLIDALKQIYSYEGNNEDALKLKKNC